MSLDDSASLWQEPTRVLAHECRIWLLTFSAIDPAWKTIQNRHRFLLFMFYLLGCQSLCFSFVGIVLENMIINSTFFPRRCGACRIWC